MDKKDVMYGVAAIVIILVMALVVKPAMTGQPVNTGIPVPTTPAAVQNTTTTIVTTPVPTPVVTTITPTPTPTPTWDKTVQTVGFVNSSTYGVTLTEEIPNGTRLDNLPLNTSMTSYAKINGQYSGTTQVIKIPFPYWETGLYGRSGSGDQTGFRCSNSHEGFRHCRWQRCAGFLFQRNTGVHHPGDGCRGSQPHCPDHQSRRGY